MAFTVELAASFAAPLVAAFRAERQALAARRFRGAGFADAAAAVLAHFRRSFGLTAPARAEPAVKQAAVAARLAVGDARTAAEQALIARAAFACRAQIQRLARPTEETRVCNSKQRT